MLNVHYIIKRTRDLSERCETLNPDEEVFPQGGIPPQRNLICLFLRKASRRSRKQMLMKTKIQIKNKTDDANDMD